MTHGTRKINSLESGEAAVTGQLVVLPLNLFSSGNFEQDPNSI